MIVMGRILGPFGVKGWIKINPFGDDPLTWAGMPQWWIADDADAPDDAWKPTRLLECRTHGSGLIAQLEAAPDRTTAEALKGCFVAAPRHAMPATADGEYYWADLIGLKVENAAGESLGEVTGLLSTGAHDVLRVVEGETERLIPFVAAYALDVDMAAGRIRVDWQKDW